MDTPCVTQKTQTLPTNCVSACLVMLLDMEVNEGRDGRKVIGNFEGEPPEGHAQIGGYVIEYEFKCEDVVSYRNKHKQLNFNKQRRNK